LLPIAVLGRFLQELPGGAGPVKGGHVFPFTFQHNIGKRTQSHTRSDEKTAARRDAGRQASAVRTYMLLMVARRNPE